MKFHEAQDTDTNDGFPATTFVEESSAAGVLQSAVDELVSMGARLRLASQEQKKLIDATQDEQSDPVGLYRTASANIALISTAPVRSREQAVQSKLAVLEQKIENLRAAIPNEANQILDEISGIRSILYFKANYGTQERFISSSVSSNPSLEETSVGHNISGKHPQDLSSSEGSQPHGTPHRQLSNSLIQLSYPGPKLLKRGVRGFFRCSEKLFHVFTEQEIEKYCDDLDAESGIDARNRAICCTSAIAAVGTQYLQHGPNRATEKSFYNIARHFFEILLEAMPLEAMKVCTLLAMYNVSSKATVARAYVETGLSLCRRFGIDQPHCSPKISEESWLKYRRPWWTLVFFSGWLASISGYISGNDVLHADTPLSEVNTGQSSDLVEIVKNEMTKISLLKLKIARMQTVTGEVPVLSISPLVQELESWYSVISKTIPISNLSQDGLPAHVRRSIYHVHLLYLGAVILLYRRIASYIVQLNRHRGMTLLLEQQKDLLRYLAEGRYAARHSATIINMMHKESAVSRRCWLVIFQSYTTGIVLLYSLVQRRLRDDASGEIQVDAGKLQYCLEVLEFCGTADHVAHRLFTALSACYGAIMSAKLNPPSSIAPSAAPSSSSDRKGPPSSPDAVHGMTETADSKFVVNYFSIPDTGDVSFQTHASKLLEMLCRPFAELDEIYTIMHHDQIVHS